MKMLPLPSFDKAYSSTSLSSFFELLQTLEDDCTRVSLISEFGYITPKDDLNST